MECCRPSTVEVLGERQVGARPGTHVHESLLGSPVPHRCRPWRHRLRVGHGGADVGSRNDQRIAGRPALEAVLAWREMERRAARLEGQWAHLVEVVERALHCRLDCLSVDGDSRPLAAGQLDGSGRVRRRRTQIVEGRHPKVGHANRKGGHQAVDGGRHRRPLAGQDGDGEVIGRDRREPNRSVRRDVDIPDVSPGRQTDSCRPANEAVGGHEVDAVDGPPVRPDHVERRRRVVRTGDPRRGLGAVEQPRDAKPGDPAPRGAGRKLQGGRWCRRRNQRIERRPGDRKGGTGDDVVAGRREGEVAAQRRLLVRAEVVVRISVASFEQDPPRRVGRRPARALLHGQRQCPVDRHTRDGHFTEAGAAPAPERELDVSHRHPHPMRRSLGRHEFLWRLHGKHRPRHRAPLGRDRHRAGARAPRVVDEQPDGDGRGRDRLCDVDLQPLVDGTRERPAHPGGGGIVVEGRVGLPLRQPRQCAFVRRGHNPRRSHHPHDAAVVVTRGDREVVWLLGGSWRRLSRREDVGRVVPHATGVDVAPPGGVGDDVTCRSRVRICRVADDGGRLGRERRIAE